MILLSHACNLINEQIIKKYQTHVFMYSHSYKNTLWDLLEVTRSTHNVCSTGVSLIQGTGCKKVLPIHKYNQNGFDWTYKWESMWQKGLSDHPVSELLFPDVWVQVCPFVVSAKGQRITRTPTALLWNKHILWLLAGAVIHLPANFGNKR